MKSFCSTLVVQLVFVCLLVCGDVPLIAAWVSSPTGRCSCSGVLPSSQLQLHARRERVETAALYAEAQDQQRTSNGKFRSNNYNRNRNRESFGGDGKLVSLHEQRIKTAGRIGTKRFVDPCKVFIGNLPFSVTDSQLKQFVLDTMGQTQLNLHSAKVIKDWKTGKSKGYGFCIFNDPIYATVCMEVLNGRKLEGRAVRVSQGKKKDQENQLYLKKKKATPHSDEESAIAIGISQAEDDDEDDDIPVFETEFDEDDLELDARLFGLQSGDDDDDEYDEDDGIFLERHFKYEEVEPNLNREQRREAQKRLKRTKKPSKGFG